MNLRLRVRGSFRLFTDLLFTGLLFAGVVSAAPLHAVGNMFRPLGTPAELVSELSILTLVICAAVFLIVASLLVYAVIRFGHREGDSRSEPAQVYGSNQVEIAWTVIPILIVFVLAMSTARITSAIQDQRIPKDAVNVTVIGHQWWWEFRYTDLKFATANELHVPLSTMAQPKLTLLTLNSADVAHGFWVPQLAGKTDVIPNRTNKMWIDPKELGTYLGNCSEYCGTQHAKMELRVVVETPEDFRNGWRSSRHRGDFRNPPRIRGHFSLGRASPATPSAERGRWAERVPI
jgi:cytochrome c oxidase subunit 2